MWLLKHSVTQLQILRPLATGLLARNLNFLNYQILYARTLDFQTSRPKCLPTSSPMLCPSILSTVDHCIWSSCSVSDQHISEAAALFSVFSAFVPFSLWCERPLSHAAIRDSRTPPWSSHPQPRQECTSLICNRPRDVYLADQAVL